MKEGKKWTSNLGKRYNLFETRVMNSGLWNTPASFWFSLNDIFAEPVDEFLVIYLKKLHI